jgi:hypothetical protein
MEICSSKRLLITTAPAPACSHFLRFFKFAVRGELETITGFLSSIPIYLVERSTIDSSLVRLTNIVYTQKPLSKLERKKRRITIR